MTAVPNPTSPSPRPLRPRRWRTILAGGVLAGVGFVAAQAGSFDFLRLDVAPFARWADQEKPKVAQGPKSGALRGHSGGSTSGSASGMFAGASRNAAGAASLSSSSDAVMATGVASVDAGVFEFSPGAAPMGSAASQEAMKFGGRFHSLVDGVGSGSGKGAGASGPGRGRQQSDLTECCTDAATPQDDTATPLGDPRLAAPTLADVVGGPVPEVGSWILMILGFGLSGLVLRSHQRRVPA